MDASQPSSECRKKREIITCQCCGEKFEFVVSAKRKYCSDKCARLHGRITRKGEGNPSWKGGTTAEGIRIRGSAAFREWRKAVFERDNYTCQDCNNRGGDLEAHHIKEFAFYPELRFDVDNGQTLCVRCHRKTFNQSLKRDSMKHLRG